MTCSDTWPADREEWEETKVFREVQAAADACGARTRREREEQAEADASEKSVADATARQEETEERGCKMEEVREAVDAQEEPGSRTQS
jgi:hypothetical protein